jgi:hypothetical protein
MWAYPNNCDVPCAHSIISEMLTSTGRFTALTSKICFTSLYNMATKCMESANDFARDLGRLGCRINWDRDPRGVS